MRKSELDRVAVWATSKRQVLQLGKSPSETFQMMKQVYGDDALGLSAVFKWYQCFLPGKRQLEDDLNWMQNCRSCNVCSCQLLPISRWSRSSSKEQPWYVLQNSVWWPKHVTCYPIQCVLTQDHRDDRMTICSDLINSADDDMTFLNWTKTGDESWCFLYDLQLKRQSNSWKLPLLPRWKKLQQDRSKDRVMLELFFDSLEIVHMEFIPDRITVNKTHYKEILCHLCDWICRKHPELWHRKNWLLLKDSAPAHYSVLVQEELAREQVTVLPHLPYSPDLAPCNFFLFPHLKAKLWGHRFHSAAKVIRDLPANIFERCFQQLYQRWQMCIAANGDCFEGRCGSV